MDFISLLGKKLKDDDIIELLEDNNLETIYEFDRLHENIDDLYWVQATKKGFALRFNKDQILDTIFLYICKTGNIKEIDCSEINFKLYKSTEEARNDFIKMNIPYQQNNIDKCISDNQCWIKGIFNNYSVHYQFNNDKLNLITIMSTFYIIS
jgi:hypothetical protein